mgnify:CR=1 FL=1
MLWVGQFSIVDGEAREESPWIGVFPESGRVEPEESSDLFVIVEVRTPTDLTTRQRELLEEFAKLEAKRAKARA